MPNKDWTTRDIVGCDVLPLSKLTTIEDLEDRESLAKLFQADEYAADMIIGGVLLPIDAGPVRLYEATGKVSGVSDRGGCRHCEEDVRWNGLRREEGAYYVGLAVGLQLAQVTTMLDKARARERLLHRAGLEGGLS